MMMGGMGGMRNWGRIGLDEETEERSLYDREVIARMISYLRPHRRKLAAIFALMLVYTGTVVAMPWMVQVIVGGYIANQELSDSEILSGLNLVMLVFLLVAVAQFLSNYLHLRIMAFVGQRILYDLRVGLFKHLQRLSMSFYDRNEVGSIMSRVQNDVQQLQELISIVVLTFADVLSLGGIIAVMVYMNAQLALITLSVVPVLFVILIVWQRYARVRFLRVRRAVAAVNAGLQENISGVRVVQSLNREQVSIKRFGQANHDSLDANLQAVRYSAALLPSVEVLAAVGLALVVYFGGITVRDPSDVGVLVAFVLFIQRFFEPVRNLTMQYGQLQRAMVSGARIFRLLDVEPEVSDRPGARRLPLARGEVRYEGVGFHYESGSPVLVDIDLHINAGETVALVGPSGAGKTSMVSLLMRLYEVTAGRITIDGFDIRDVSMDSMSRQISVVTQEPFLFSGTVRENIRYNRTQASDEEVVRAATAVGAHEFIGRLESGYDTELQERGGNLSVGQRQLVSFARALVADPRILILDEATATIDTTTETLIQRALGEILRDRTALVIAHRLSTVRNADRIVVLDEGRIAEQGTHTELMGRGGLYSELVSYTTVGEATNPLLGRPKFAR